MSNKVPINSILESKAKKGILFLEITTKRELINNSKSYQIARTKISKNARLIYLNSNKPKYCLICGYNKHIEICHIRAVSDFPDDAFIGEINDPINLMSLCPTHHWEFDNDMLDLDNLDFNVEDLF